MQEIRIQEKIQIQSQIDIKKKGSWGLRVLNSISCWPLGHQSSQLTQSSLTAPPPDEDNFRLSETFCYPLLFISRWFNGSEIFHTDDIKQHFTNKSKDPCHCCLFQMVLQFKAEQICILHFMWEQDLGLSIIRVLILDFTCSVVNLVPSTVVVDSINRVVIHLNIHKKIYKWDCFKTLSLSTLFMNLPPFCLVLLILFLFQLVFSF